MSDFTELFARQYPRTSGTAAPTGGTWSVGSFSFNEAPAAGAPFGWVCVTAGTPGTWIAVDSIAANAAATIAAAGTATFATDVLDVDTGGFNITLTAPTSLQNGAVLNVVNNTASPVTIVAGSPATLYAGSAVVSANTSAQFKAIYPNIYRIA